VSEHRTHAEQLLHERDATIRRLRRELREARRALKGVRENTVPGSNAHAFAVMALRPKPAKKTRKR
jgi:hypothetical protein